jgi:Flp pilus assembly pilin Flp
MRRLYTTLQPPLAALRRRLAAAHAEFYLGASGQGLVEYGLILVLIMVVCVAIIGLLGQTISQVWYDKLIQGFPN